MSQTLSEFLIAHRIHEVECVIPDMTGIARGKILPRDLFLAEGQMRLPKSVLLNTVNGQQPDNGPYVGDTDPDMVCVPDAATVDFVIFTQQAAQVGQLKARQQPDRIEQSRQPGVVMAPGIAVDDLASQTGIDFGRHPGRRFAAALQQFAADAVQRFGRWVPMQPVRLGLDQRTERAAFRFDETDFDRVTAPAEARGFDIQDDGRRH